LYYRWTGISIWFHTVKIGSNTIDVIHMISLVNISWIVSVIRLHFYCRIGTEKQKQLVVGGEACMWGGELNKSIYLLWLSFSLQRVCRFNQCHSDHLASSICSCGTLVVICWCQRTGSSYTSTWRAALSLFETWYSSCSDQWTKLLQHWGSYLRFLQGLLSISWNHEIKIYRMFSFYLKK